MISGAMFFNVIVLTIAAFQVFDQAYLLFWRDQSNASPEASLFYGVYLFQQAFRQFNFGFAVGHGLAAVRDHHDHHASSR